MAFIKNENSFGVGDYVQLTQEKRSPIGRFEVGSIVRITGLGERGYDIADEQGNRVCECGYTGFKKIGD